MSWKNGIVKLYSIQMYVQIQSNPCQNNDILTTTKKYYKISREPQQKGKRRKAILSKKTEPMSTLLL
jgi:hypothetical protein